jgi:uncharacterized protein (TIGR02118 family)
MYKMIYVGKKNPKMSMAEFRNYYLNTHAPLFLKTIPYVKKYVINFAIERPGKKNPFDFITEIWWNDKEDVRKFYGSDEYKNIIQPDEVKLAPVGQFAYFEELVQKW